MMGRRAHHVRMLPAPRLPPAAALAALLAAAALLLPACRLSGGDAGDGARRAPIVLYSGRSEQLIGPLIERFTELTGTPVRTRYGDTAALAAMLMEEGDRTPADVVLSQDGAALGALSRAGALRPLPQDLLARVPRGLRSPEGDWVGLSGRARVVVYNTETLTGDELPATLEQVADPRHRGRFGIAPTNASLQAQLAAYAALEGLPALERLLRDIAANEPRIYPRNGPIVDAVLAGEIDWGLVNHYYLLRALDEDPDAPGRNSFMPGGGAGGFVNVSGGALAGDDDHGLELLRYLLSDDAQRYFAEETFELPLVEGVAPPAGLPAIGGIATTAIDWAELAAVLEPTLERIHSSGLSRFR